MTKKKTVKRSNAPKKPKQTAIPKISRLEFLELDNHRLEAELRQSDISLINEKIKQHEMAKKLLEAQKQAFTIEILLAQRSRDTIKSKDANAKKSRINIVHKIQDRLGLKRSDRLGYCPDTLEVDTSEN